MGDQGSLVCGSWKPRRRAQYGAQYGTASPSRAASSQTAHGHRPAESKSTERLSRARGVASNLSFSDMFRRA